MTATSEKEQRYVQISEHDSATNMINRWPFETGATEPIFYESRSQNIKCIFMIQHEAMYKYDLITSGLFKIDYPQTITDRPVKASVTIDKSKGIMYIIGGTHGVFIVYSIENRKWINTNTITNNIAPKIPYGLLRFLPYPHNELHLFARKSLHHWSMRLNNEDLNTAEFHIEPIIDMVEQQWIWCIWHNLMHYYYSIISMMLLV